MTQPFRLSANISMLFVEHPFLDRIDAAAKAGFAAVECHFPYSIPIADIAARLSARGVTMNAINTPTGDPIKGEFGCAALPGREDRFRAGIEQALDYARGLGVGVIHCMSGAPPPGDRAAARDTFLANMRWAGRRAREAGVALVIEPLNIHDRPGYFVSRSDDVAALLTELGEDSVKLMFDIYHIQIMEGDLLRRLDRHWPLIGHVQIAGAPARHEPDEGEIAYRAILAALAERGYSGWVGAEYNPRARTEDGLDWAKPYLAS